MKQCSKCKQVKENSEFYKETKAKDGLQSYCKVCANNKVKKFCTSEKGRLWHRMWWRTELGKRTKEARKRSGYTKILNILNNAVKDGKIEKPDKCPICSSDYRIEGHHTDYTKPLEVIWCCSQCHKNIHRDFLVEVPIC